MQDLSSGCPLVTHSVASLLSSLVFCSWDTCLTPSPSLLIAKLIPFILFFPLQTCTSRA